MFKKLLISLIFIFSCLVFGISADAENVAYINNMRVYVSGQVKPGQKNDIFITAVKKGSNVFDSTSILYANQIKTDESGEYEINFNTSTADIDIYVNDDAGIKKQIPGKEYTSRYFVVCNLDIKQVEDNIYRMSADIKNIFSETKDVNLYIAMYNSENKLIKVDCENVKLTDGKRDLYGEINVTLPEDAEVVKGFAWIDAIPVSDTEMLYDHSITKKISVTREKHNIFTTDDDIYYTVKGEDNKIIHYIVRNFKNNIVLEGDFAAKESGYRFKLPLNKPGYYTLSFKYKYFPDFDSKTEYLGIVTNQNFDSVTDSPFGVNMHLSSTTWGVEPILVDYAALMGAKSIRTDYEWKYIEYEKGVYSVNRNGLEEMRKHNLRMNIATGYGNSLYDGQQWFPWNDEGRKAFSRYILGVMDVVGDLVDEIDIWNEWYGGGDQDSYVYYSLLKECYPAIKAKYPNVMILGNACDFKKEGQDFYWYPKFLSHGGYSAYKYMDGIYPHVYYDNTRPEDRMVKSKEFYDKYNKSTLYTRGKDLKMYLTETGISTYDGGNISEEEQASMLVRSFITALSLGFEKVYWYDFMNDNLPSYEREYNFGLVRYATDSKGKYTPKPAYVAYSVMARQLTGYTCTDMTIPADDSGVYKAIFSNGEKTKMVLWSLTDNEVRLDKEYKITDIMGEETMGTSVHTDIYPQYCELM